MKSIRVIPFVVIFGACLIIGILAGAWTGRAAGAGLERTSETIRQDSSSVPDSKLNKGATNNLHRFERRPAKAETAPNGQRNLLLLFVDDLTSKNQKLEGAWLLLYLPPSPHLTLVPLFPAVLSQPAPDPDTHLSAAFRMNEDGTLAEEFVTTIKEYDLWWNNFLVFDHHSLEFLIDLMSPFDLGFGEVTGEAYLGSLENLTADDALKSHAGMINAVCNYQPKLNRVKVDPADLRKELGEHFSTDLNPIQILADWHILAVTPGRTCKFPTLPFELNEQVP